MLKNAWQSIRNFPGKAARSIKSFFSRKAKAAPPPPALDVTRVTNPLFSGTDSLPGSTYHKGAWTLFIYYRNPGTRSQGQHGVLLKDGSEIKPAQAGEIIQTELGAMKYVLDPEQMTVLWDTTGWMFVDTNAVPGTD